MPRETERQPTQKEIAQKPVTVEDMKDAYSHAIHALAPVAQVDQVEALRFFFRYLITQDHTREEIAHAFGIPVDRVKREIETIQQTAHKEQWQQFLKDLSLSPLERKKMMMKEVKDLRTREQKPSIDEIGNITGASKSAIDRYIKELVATGVVSAEQVNKHPTPEGFHPIPFAEIATEFSMTVNGVHFTFKKIAAEHPHHFRQENGRHFATKEGLDILWNQQSSRQKEVSLPVLKPRTKYTRTSAKKLARGYGVSKTTSERLLRELASHHSQDIVRPGKRGQATIVSGKGRQIIKDVFREHKKAKQKQK